MSAVQDVLRHMILVKLLELCKRNDFNYNGVVREVNLAFEQHADFYRRHPPAQQQGHLATVWHQGTESFYHAQLLRKMSRDEVAAESSDGPEFHDGCELDGFPGGCVRMGCHTPAQIDRIAELEVALKAMLLAYSVDGQWHGSKVHAQARAALGDKLTEGR